MPSQKTPIELAQRETRGAHRALLRAARADDAQEARRTLYALYDPSDSPLTKLTDAPSPQCVVPIVDAALLTAYHGGDLRAELVDNLATTGHSFDLGASELRHLSHAFEAAARAGQDASAAPEAVARMHAELEQAGFGAGEGLVFPDALGQRI